MGKGPRLRDASAAPARIRQPRTCIALPPRPQPPEELLEIPWDGTASHFLAAPDVVLWIRRTFLEHIHGSALANPDHEHLVQAHLGVLWTNAENQRRGRNVIGTAEIFTPRGDHWVKARQGRQIRDWFGTIPDFLITLSAPYSAEATDAQFCALVEHELYHCAQAMRDGSPLWRRDGAPVWAIRGHDIEEFTGVVRRYGTVTDDVRAFVAAANAKPLIDAGAIARGCGTCLKAAA
jgi:hypothetical protein